jgi:predicted RND superfamily exporter protein
MFILLSGLSEAQSKISVEERMAETLRIAGVGISITSLTDVIAFAAGIGSTFISVRNFCIYTSKCACFIMHVNLVCLNVW